MLENLCACSSLKGWPEKAYFIPVRLHGKDSFERENPTSGFTEQFPGKDIQCHAGLVQ